MPEPTPPKVEMGYTPDDKKAKHVLTYQPGPDGQTRLVWTKHKPVKE